jgi:hypothetical protein
MNKNIFYYNPLSDKKSFVIADTTMLAVKGAYLKPFPKFIDIDTMEQIVCEPRDRTDYILQSCLSSNIALILITTN